MNIRLSLMLVVALSATFASATLFTETEPNDTLATANPFFGFAHNDVIQGNSVASTGTGVDYFRLNVATASLGIYRHQLVIDSQIAGHSASLRGLNQTSGVGLPGTIGTTEVSLQSTSTTTSPARMNVWYGFGKGEVMDYRVTGAAATTSDYFITHSVTQITALDLGTIGPGSLSFSTRNATTGTLDTDTWLYDGNLDPIAFAGNDDSAVLTTSAQSDFTRTLGAGTYYIALSRFNLANNQASPADDDFRTGSVLGTAGAILGTSSTSTTAPFLMTVSDGVNTLNWNGSVAGAYDVEFAKFTVDAVPEPGTMAVIGLAIAGIAAKRRKK